MNVCEHLGEPEICGAASMRVRILVLVILPLFAYFLRPPLPLTFSLIFCLYRISIKDTMRVSLDFFFSIKFLFWNSSSWRMFMENMQRYLKIGFSPIIRKPSISGDIYVKKSHMNKYIAHLLRPNSLF